MRKNVDQKDSFIIPILGEIYLILQYYAFCLLEGMLAEMWETVAVYEWCSCTLCLQKQNNFLWPTNVSLLLSINERYQ